MISPRHKENETLTAISWHKLAATETAKEFEIAPECFEALFTLYTIQREQNDLVKPSKLRERHGKSPRWTSSLLTAEYIERTGEELNYLYNVTMRGEYVVRAYLIRLSRLVNDTKLSKVRLNREKRNRLNRYFRPANKMGKALY